MPIEQVSLDKRLIFTVTPGRSGTSYLTKLLETVPGVSAFHEPEPNFVAAMRQTQTEPSVAYIYLYQQKLPTIAATPGKIYAETSNLICKGFLEPMIRMGLRPDLIILRRPPREVAWSYLERETVPARTTLGVQYLLEPRDLGVLPLARWESTSDYQLCFWYALEIERRQLFYADMARHYGLRIVDITNTELNDPDHYARMLSGLNLPVTPDVLAQHGRISGQRHNLNTQHLDMPGHLEREEEPIWETVGHYHPWLREHVAKRYG